MAGIRFPCTFFFEWKTANGKHHVASKQRVKSENKIIAFREKVELVVLMVFDVKTAEYRKKESVVMVNLLSNSRPKDPKLVGRVTVELSAIANQEATK
jgi:hypothetical protein